VYVSQILGMDEFTSVFCLEILVGVENCGAPWLAHFAGLTEPEADPKRGRQATLTKYRKVAKNRQFQANEIVGVDPVFRCLPDEGTLIASSRGIPFDWMTASSNKIIEFREFDDDSVVVILIERPFLEVVLDEGRLQGSVCSFL